MVAHATARVEWDGSVVIAFRFDADFVERLKGEIPFRYRKWQPTTKTWQIDAAYAAEAVALLREWFGQVDVLDPRRTANPPPPQRDASGPYATLHLLPTAPTELVEAAQRCLAKLEHPDVKPANERTLATRRMQAINIAADTIRRQRTAGVA